MKREFTFLGEHGPDGFVPHDRDEVRQTLLDLEGALFQLGGMFVVGSIREQLGPDEYVTVGVRITYDSFAPARELAEPIEAPD
jgi:hypothetical protein